MKTNNIKSEKLSQLANCIRFLSIDAVQKANSGHPGMPMGMADIATVLFKNHLKFDPTDYDGNGHCPHIPQKSNGWNNYVRSRMKIFHYGYYDEELRQKKYKFYNETQPSPHECDNYTHTISGDGIFSLRIFFL